MNALSERFAALTPREQLVLVVGAVAALIIIVYTFAWRPWQDELSRLRAQVPQKEQTLAWMQAQAGQVKTLSEASAGAPTETGLPLLTLIERSANEADIRKAITRMSPGDEEDQVRVWMDNADFDRWLRWLESLKQSGVEVAEANVDRSAENQVNIRATLQR